MKTYQGCNKQSPVCHMAYWGGRYRLKRRPVFDWPYHSSPWRPKTYTQDVMRSAIYKFLGHYPMPYWQKRDVIRDSAKRARHRKLFNRLPDLRFMEAP